MKKRTKTILLRLISTESISEQLEMVKLANDDDNEIKNNQKYINSINSSTSNFQKTMN